MAIGLHDSFGSDRDKVLSSVKKVIDKNKVLNDPIKLIRMNQFQINSILKAYSIDLRKSLFRFFAGTPIERMVQAAKKDFKGSVSGKLRSAKDITPQVKQQFLSQIKSITSEMEGRQRTKIFNFKNLVEGSANTGKEFTKELKNVITINNKNIDLRDIRDNWAISNKRFGAYNSVAFRNGAKYPLDAYTEMRTLTTAQEVHRLTTTLEAGQNDILTGKISSHGAIDSCRIHEGEIVFFSTKAKRTFIKRYPKLKKARRWKTVEEIEADGTHIFKPNCKHLVQPFPIQFFDDIKDEVDKNKVGSANVKDIKKFDKEARLAS